MIDAIITGPMSLSEKAQRVVFLLMVIGPILFHKREVSTFFSDLSENEALFDVVIFDLFRSDRFSFDDRREIFMFLWGHLKEEAWSYFLANQNVVTFFNELFSKEDGSCDPIINQLFDPSRFSRRHQEYLLKYLFQNFHSGEEQNHDSLARLLSCEKAKAFCGQLFKEGWGEYMVCDLMGLRNPLRGPEPQEGVGLFRGRRRRNSLPPSFESGNIVVSQSFRF